MRCLAFHQGARAATQRTCSSVSSSWIWHWLSATACSSADSDVMATGGTESVRVSGSEDVDGPAPEEEPAAAPAVAVAARPYEAPVTARRCGPTAPCSAWRGRGRARGITCAAVSQLDYMYTSPSPQVALKRSGSPKSPLGDSHVSWRKKFRREKEHLFLGST